MLKRLPTGLRALASLCAALWASGAAATPFTLVLLPDTQHYSDSAVNIVHFEAQTQWISDNGVAENIVFSTLVGDVVENGGEGAGMNQVEWDRAVGALDTLHDDPADVPYSTVAGNHDYDIEGVKGAATQYIANLGPARYAAKTWFLDAAADDVNMAQDFLGDGEAYIHIGLEWRPSDDAIAFAQEVIAANPTLPVVFSTHEHLGTGNPASRRTGGGTPDGTGDNPAEDVYRKLIEPFPQVFLALSGHVFGNGRIESTTALGRTVHEVMTDYQNDPNGGNGWLQLVEFRPDDDEIGFETLSPTYVSGVTAGPDRSVDPAGNFAVDFDLNGLRSYLATHAILHFRQGQDNGFGVYSDAVDTHVGDGAQGDTLPGVAYGNADTVSVDGDSDHEQTLMRFEQIVGPGAGQIPAGTVIERAILTLTTEGSGSDGDGASLHRMIADWDGNSTWNSLVNGVQTGSEAMVAEDANTGARSKGTGSYDVTTSIQAWVNGETNRGWVFLPNGNNRTDFRTAEWAGLAERPLLTVVYSTVPTPKPFVQTNHFFTGFENGVPLTVPSIDPAGITYHAPSGHAFISDSEINEVGAVYPGVVAANLFEISLDGNTLHNSWDLNALGNDEPTGITYNEFDGHFYVTNDNSPQGAFRYSFDGSTFTEVDFLPIPGPPGGGTPDPEGIASDPATGRMWAVDGFGQSFVTFTYDDVLGIQVESNIDLTVTIPNAAERPDDPEGVAYSPETGNLYMVSTPEQAIYEITTAGAFVARYDLDGFVPGTVGPQGIGVAPAPAGPRTTVRLLMVDGGIDNDADPNERDGNVYQADITYFVCFDGLDNDSDGDTDLEDSGCADGFDFSEEPDCSDGLDNDGDGLFDFPDDPGCSDALDVSERDALLLCDDGIDNDGDGGIDFDPITFASPGDNVTAPSGVGDPGCKDPTWPTENPACNNGENDDSDALSDYDGGFNAPPGSTFGGMPGLAPDTFCVDRAWADKESQNGCGLGFEAALVLSALFGLRRRRARREV